MNHRTRNILRYLFVVLLGVFLHFAYELSGENPIMGLFSLVSESVWEHLKLVFFPMLVLTLWDMFTNQRNNLCFLPARTLATLAGMAFVVILYYTVTGILGFQTALINILIYLLGVLVVFLVEKKLCHRCNTISVKVAIILWALFFVLFLVFTIAPPALGIFIPPAE
jgi:hypothetical protein